jgi:tRNA A37 methylthiotransferase MiaB
MNIPVTRGELRSRLKKEYHEFVQQESGRRGMSIADLIHEMVDQYRDRQYLQQQFHDLHEHIEEIRRARGRGDNPPLERL